MEIYKTREYLRLCINGKTCCEYLDTDPIWNDLLKYIGFVACQQSEIKEVSVYQRPSVELIKGLKGSQDVIFRNKPDSTYNCSIIEAVYRGGEKDLGIAEPDTEF